MYGAEAAARGASNPQYNYYKDMVPQQSQPMATVPGMNAQQQTRAGFTMINPNQPRPTQP